MKGEIFARVNVKPAKKRLPSREFTEKNGDWSPATIFHFFLNFRWNNSECWVVNYNSKNFGR